jgi:hypothetical protein
MKKDRDWVDFLNTAANVAQTLELHSVNRTLAEQSQREQRREHQVDREDRLREHIFQLQDDVDILLRRMKAHPLPAMALAVEIKRVMETQSITTARFRSYEDKERVKKVLDGLALVCDQCGPRLTPEEMEDVKKYLEIRAQMPALNTLITLATEIAELENSKCELKDLIRKKAEFKLPPWYVSGLVLGGLGVTGTIVSFIGLLEWDWPWYPLVFAFSLWIVGVVVNAEKLKPKPLALREGIASQIKALQDSIRQKTVVLNFEVQSHAASLSSLREQIGDLSLADYQRIKADREVFVQNVLATQAGSSTPD